MAWSRVNTCGVVGRSGPLGGRLGEWGGSSSGLEGRTLGPVVLRDGGGWSVAVDTNRAWICVGGNWDLCVFPGRVVPSWIQ